MTEFTPLASLLGGMLIGFSAVALMALKGRIAGISGITSGALPPWTPGEAGWRIAFLAGMLGAPLAYMAVTGAPIMQTVSDNAALMIVAGLLVGYGSVTGSGCTSGHGVCGLSRFSTRSLVSVATFMTAAAVTVFVTRHAIGG